MTTDFSFFKVVKVINGFKVFKEQSSSTITLATEKILSPIYQNIKISCMKHARYYITYTYA